MAILFVTLGVMLLVVGGMAVGVLMGREPLKGSCGGVGKALAEPDYVCDLCGNDEDKCEEINSNGGELKSTALAYDAVDSAKSASSDETAKKQ